MKSTLIMLSNTLVCSAIALLSVVSLSSRVEAQTGFHVDSSVLNVSNSASEMVFYYYTELFNDSAVDLNLRWVLVEDSMPLEWQFRISDPQTFHPSFTDSADFVLGAQPSALDKILVNFFPNNTPGFGSVQLSLFNIHAPQDSILLTVNATATPVPKDTSTMTSIPNPKFDLQALSLYPNPARDFLMVDISKGMHQYNYIISDMSGKAIKLGALSGNSIDIANLETGFYHISVEAESALYNACFIKCSSGN